MSYTALYRKWRPKTFDEVKGQDAVCTTLKNQIKSNKIGHAYLFCGTRGTGKTSIAKIMARAVNCENTKDGNPCNECDTCKAILKESSINVIELDAASNNGVDDIRLIKEQVQYPPTFGKYRVFIIDEVHMLSGAAFNALLKTLEEPPEYVIFILATTEVHKIPVTVLSRCQRYDFKRISVDTISKRIKELCVAENIQIEDKAIEYIAKSADGAMRDALSLLDECVAFKPDGEISYDEVLDILGVADIKTFSEIFSAISQIDTERALKIIEEITVAGRELSQFVNDFLWYLRNLLIIKVADDANKIVDASKENLEEMSKLAMHVSKESLMRYIRIFSDLSNKMRYSSQKRVLLELGIIKLLTPEMENDMEAVLDRISKMEQKFSEGSFISTQKNTDIIKEVTEKKTEKKQIVLPKAMYDDFVLLKKDWSKIVAGIGTGMAAICKDTLPEPTEDGRVCIVFPNISTYNLGTRNDELKKFSEYVSHQYGKQFEFMARVKENGEKATTEYVSDEDLNQIHIEIHKDL